LPSDSRMYGVDAAAFIQDAKRETGGNEKWTLREEYVLYKPTWCEINSVYSYRNGINIVQLYE
jgi:hypothetical protein